VGRLLANHAAWQALMTGARPAAAVDTWQAPLAEFQRARAACLLYD
jgi:hypothetical protein